MSIQSVPELLDKSTDSDELAKSELLDKSTDSDELAKIYSVFAFGNRHVEAARVTGTLAWKDDWLQVSFSKPILVQTFTIIKLKVAPEYEIFRFTLSIRVFSHGFGTVDYQIHFSGCGDGSFYCHPLDSYQADSGVIISHRRYLSFTTPQYRCLTEIDGVYVMDLKLSARDVTLTDYQLEMALS